MRINSVNMTISAVRRSQYPTDEKPDSDGWVVGKRKPFLKYIGNEEKISKYEKAFNELKIKYKGISYHDAFPNRKNA